LRLDTDLHIITGYRSPHAPAELFKEEFDNLLSKIPAEDRKIVIGDFNYDCADMENENAFIKRMKELNLTNCLQVDGFGDRNFTTINNTQIDVVFSNHPFLYAGVYESVFSDHKPIFCEILRSEDETLRRKGLASLRRNSNRETLRSKHDKHVQSSKKDMSIVPVKKEKTERKKQRTTKRKSSSTRNDEPRKKVVVPPVPIVPIVPAPTVQYSSEKSILKNSFKETADIHGVTVRFHVYNNCAFDSITLGLLHAMKDDLFDEALKRDCPYVEYFDFIRTLKIIRSEDINAQVLLYLLSLGIIEIPTETNQLVPRDMECYLEGRFEKLLDNYRSYYGLCEECRTENMEDGRVVRIYRSYCGRFTFDEIFDLEVTLRQRFAINGRHCGQATNKTCVSPGFFIESYCEPLRLVAIPRNVNICGMDYTLSFVVSFVESKKHFVTYCLDGTRWLKYDDLASYAKIVNSREEEVQPELMFYILNNHRSR
jgi:hypothetical protein